MGSSNNRLEIPALPIELLECTYSPCLSTSPTRGQNRMIYGNPDCKKSSFKPFIILSSSPVSIAFIICSKFRESNFLLSLLNLHSYYSQCQSAAISEVVKCYCAPVSGAISSTVPLPLLPPLFVSFLSLAVHETHTV